MSYRDDRYRYLEGPQTAYWLSDPSAQPARPSVAQWRDSLNTVRSITVTAEVNHSVSNPATGSSAVTTGTGTCKFNRVAFHGVVPCATSPGAGGLAQGEMYVLSTLCCPKSPVFVLGPLPEDEDCYTTVTTNSDGTMTTSHGSFSSGFGFSRAFKCRPQSQRVTSTPVAGARVIITSTQTGSPTGNAEQTLLVNGDVGTFLQSFQMPDGSTYDIAYGSPGQTSGNGEYVPAGFSPDILVSSENNGIRLAFVGKYALSPVALVANVTPGGADGSGYYVTASTLDSDDEPVSVTLGGDIGNQFPVSGNDDVLSGTFSASGGDYRNGSGAGYSYSTQYTLSST